MDMAAGVGSMDEPTQVQAVKVTLDPEGIKRLGSQLASRFTTYEQDRRMAELKWARNARQVLGIYDPDVDSQIPRNRSRAYPKLTRVKCVSMLSRLMNMLFQTNEKCWGVDASPLPVLEQEDLQKVLNTVFESAQQSGQGQIDNQVIESAIHKFAQQRAKRLERELEDQLEELGGSRTLNFVTMCRMVLMSGIQYGMGVLKGPMLERQQGRTWQADKDGKLLAVPKSMNRPRFEFVPIWDYYPDMSAKYRHQMDGQFVRVVMSRAQVNQLKKREDFLAPQIEAFLSQTPGGNYKRRAYETELKAMGVQINVTEAERNKYEAIVWYGYTSGRDLAMAGADIPEDKLDSALRSEVWLLGDYVVKASLDAWAELEPEQPISMFHHFVFEDDESTLLGNGLPNIVRDSQMGLCSSVRMSLDNGSLMRNFEVNTELLRADQDTSSINADKVWYREDTNPGTVGVPAVRVIDFPMHLAEYDMLAKLFLGFADQETFVGPATGGDMSRGPSEPFRTAAGASMLRGDAALPFKDTVRNFDVFTESVIGSLIVFNKHFNDNPDISGDFTPVARGATTLIAKEVLGIQLDNLVQTLTDREKRYLDDYGLLKARVQVRDLDVSRVVCDEDEAKRRDEQDAQASVAAKAQQDKMIEAQVRQVLADTLKAATQAQKNSIAADAAETTMVINAMEKGILPHELASTKEAVGTGVDITGAAAGVGARVAGAAQAAATTRRSSAG